MKAASRGKAEGERVKEDKEGKHQRQRGLKMAEGTRRRAASRGKAEERVRGDKEGKHQRQREFEMAEGTRRRAASRGKVEERVQGRERGQRAGAQRMGEGRGEALG
jgi:hypothetical protein